MAIVKVVPMPGPQGDGFNFRGAWVTNTLYKKNDVVTQNGSSYVANYDYQDTSGPSLDGDLWAPLALKGDAGTGSADIADFVFNTIEEPDYESTMTVTNNDMVIKTVVDTEASGNIRVESAQDIVLNAGGDAYLGDSSSQINRIATIGDIQEAGTADFVFEFIDGDSPDADNETDESRITIANHDMLIRTTRDDGQDADITVESADDLWLTAVGDDIRLRAGDDVEIITNTDGDTEHNWEFTSGGGFRFPDGTVQTTAYIADSEPFVPLPDFLDYAEGRDQLPTLNTNFGWDSNGVWFGPTAGEGNDDSYPIFTNFTIPSDTPVQVSFNAEVDAECSDIGVALYVDGTIPQWTFGPNQTRIAAQFNCPSAELNGLTVTGSGEGSGLPGPGTYRYVISYNPLADSSKVSFSIFDSNQEPVNVLYLDERLPEGSYRIGFAADYDFDEGANSDKSYIRNLEIVVNPGEGQTVYQDSLTNGNSGAPNTNLDIADFVFDLIQEEGTESRMTINNHDMIIRTTRDDDQDADISIRSADDVWISANDEVEITAVNQEVRIITGSAEQNTWKFRQDRIIGVDGDTGIESLDNNDVKGRLKFEPSNGRALLQAYGNNQTATFTDSWDTATWTTLDPQLSQLTLTNASSIISFMDATGYQVDNLKISVNGSDYGIYNGASSGDGAITFYIENLLPIEEVSVTEVRFQYAFSSKVDIDYDEGDLLIDTQDEMDIVISAADDLYLRAKGDDVFIEANNDITFTANDGSEAEQSWRMEIDGKFQFPAAGYIENGFGNSGDGYGNDTFKIVPDSDLQTNQYLIIDPTSPNHIHVRAGGDIDESTAELILGGEKNNVVVSDSGRNVVVNTRPGMVANSYTNVNENNDIVFIANDPADIEVGYTVNVDGTDWVVYSAYSEGGFKFVSARDAEFNYPTFTPGQSYTFIYEPTWNNQWTFASNGTLYGPAMGGLRVSNILNDINSDLSVNATDAVLSLNGQDVSINATDGNVLLNGNSGEYLNDPSDPDNQIATVRDIVTAVPQAIGEEDSPSFNQIYLTNSDGTGQNVKIGDDAWIGDVNLANYVGITGAQDSTEAGIVLGSALENRIYTDGSGLTLESTTGDMNFYMDGAAYIGPSVSDNRIAQIKDLNDYQNAIGGVVSYSPTWSGTGLTFNGTPATGSYIKIGKLVQVQIDVLFTDVTNFGTGQYSLTVPFNSLYHTDVYGGSIHNTGPTTDHYSLKGHLSDNSNIMTLWFISGSSQDQVFDNNSPINLNTTDKFHMSFSYICE